MEQFTNALQRQSIAREEEGGEEEGGLPEAAEDLADEMAVAALSRTISMREDPPSGLPYCGWLVQALSIHWADSLAVATVIPTISMREGPPSGPPYCGSVDAEQTQLCSQLHHQHALRTPFRSACPTAASNIIVESLDCSCCWWSCP